MARHGVYATFAKHAVRAVGRRARAAASAKGRAGVAAEVRRVLGRGNGRSAEPVAAEAPPPAPEPGTLGANDARWGSNAEEHVDAPALGWLDNGWIVRNYVFPKIFGGTDADTWGRAAVDAFGIARDKRWLSLGCGSGNLELQMAEHGLFASMVAIDGSPRAVEVARSDADRRKVHTIDFQVADLNTVELPPSTFDVVHVNMALHHVAALEHLVFQVNRTLRDGGVFLANEFVGPNQFQHTPQRLAMVRERLSLLPERLRWNPVARETKTEWRGFTREFWNDWDPTESVRSDEIPRILLLNFPRLRAYPYGGSILNLVLENIVQNFDLANADDMRHMRALLRFEEEALTDGRASSDFVYYVCPRGDRLARSRGRIAATLDVRRRVTMALRSRALD